VPERGGRVEGVPRWDDASDRWTWRRLSGGQRAVALLLGAALLAVAAAGAGALVGLFLRAARWACCEG